MGLDESTIRDIQAGLNATLKELSAKHQVDLRITKIKSENALDFYMVIDGKSTQNREAVERSEFASMCGPYGLSPNDYGRVFMSSGKPYKICGISPRARKYNVLAKNERGTEYKFPAMAVKLHLQMSA